MREVQTDIAMRWFAGYRLHERLPDHSSLTGFGSGGVRSDSAYLQADGGQTVVRAGLVDGETVHVDATLIRADVSWESMVEDHVEQVME